MSPSALASDARTRLVIVPAHGRAIKAVLFDLDGTMYPQWPLRLLMAAELASADVVAGLRRRRRSSRTILAFRRVHEELRAAPPNGPSIHHAMVSVAAQRTGVPALFAEQAVREWIFQRPLKYLRVLRRPGLRELLARLRARAVQAGVLSDYPVTEKVRALGLDGAFSLLLCTTDPEINALKPSPLGFLRACELWGLMPGQVLYVGDRPDVDAVGAAAAGLPCAIIGARKGPTAFRAISHFQELQYVLDTDC